MRLYLYLPLLLLATVANADSVVAARTIRAHTIIEATDVRLAGEHYPAAATALEDVIGLESRTTIYAGKPVSVDQIARPAMIERNQAVVLIFRGSAISITTEGRALGRGAAGEMVKVMNSQSKTTVTGTIQSDGSVVVH